MKFIKYFLIFILAMFTLAPAAMAAPVTPDYLFGGDATNIQKLSEQSGLGLQDPRETVAKVINIILGFLGIIAVVLILFGGFMWMTAAGSEEKIGTAKKIMSAGVIGLVIVLAAFGIARFVISSMITATSDDSATTEGTRSPDAPARPPVEKAAAPSGGAQPLSEGGSLSSGDSQTENNINDPANPITGMIIQ